MHSLKLESCEKIKESKISLELLLLFDKEVDYSRLTARAVEESKSVYEVCIDARKQFKHKYKRDQAKKRENQAEIREIEIAQKSNQESNK